MRVMGDGMLEIVQIQAADYIAQSMDLLRANWTETGFDFDLAPSVQIVQQLQDAGVMFVVAAFHGRQLVGYSSAMVSAHHFNPAIICCSSDALFVDPAFRNRTVLLRLMQETERIGKERGATRMLWHTRAGTSFAAVLEKRGYEPADIVVMKRI